MNFSTFISRELPDNPDLACLLTTILESIKRVSEGIDITKAKTDKTNYSGDQQLEMDVLADVIVHDTLLECKVVSILASEERKEEIIMNGDKYCVAYDPLDGSSLIDANFAIGTIFGVFPGTHMLGRTGREMVASVFGVYGPRTTVVLTVGTGVYEFILQDDGFIFSKENIRIDSRGKYFAPGNLRACKSNPGYKKLVEYWLENQYTLRYSGGMVPDINHIFVKGEGVFAYPRSKENIDGKLRLLYECAPMAFIVEQAGGKASNGHTAILDLPINGLHQKTPIFIGSSSEVDRAIDFKA